MKQFLPIQFAMHLASSSLEYSKERPCKGSEGGNVNRLHFADLPG